MTVVVGIGTERGGDDIAGLLVARLLRERVPADVRVVEHGGDPAGLITAWRGADRVVVIDAVRSGAPPGTVHRLDRATAADAGRGGGCSSHGLGLAEAIRLVEALGRRPRRLSVVGVEGERFGVGTSPCPEVLAAVPEAAEAVLRELRRPDGQSMDCGFPRILARGDHRGRGRLERSG